MGDALTVAAAVTLAAAGVALALMPRRERSPRAFGGEPARA